MNIVDFNKSGRDARRRLSLFLIPLWRGLQIEKSARFITTAACAISLVGSALAADRPSRAPPVYLPPEPVFTWTGIYLGGQIGYAWTESNSYIESVGHSVLGDAFYDSYYPQTNAHGVIGGGHLGYNLQINQWVLGLEGDLDGSSLGKTTNFSPYSNYYQDHIPTIVQSDLGVQSSIRGRVGIAFDHVLLYGTSGVAFGRSDSWIATDYPGCVRTFTHNCLFGVGPFFGHDSFSQTRVGWTAGAGIEYAIARNWSVRTEYRLTQFGNTTGYLANTYPAAYPGEAVNAGWRHDLSENRVQVGFSYKFDTNQRGLK
jgi:outer membrane immunogenic protein